MVKYVITIAIVQILALYVIAQEKIPEKDILLRASFSRDSISMGDSLKVNLFYTNYSKGIYRLQPEAIIGLIHNNKDFISYESPDRITYKLNELTNYDSIVSLKANEEYTFTFSIITDSTFFYEGDNTILVYYHLFNKPSSNKKRQKQIKQPLLSLWSNPIKVNVSKNK